MTRCRSWGTEVVARLLVPMVLLAGLVVPGGPGYASTVDGPVALFGTADLPRIRANAAGGGAVWFAGIRGRADAALARDTATACERVLGYDLPDLAMAYLVTEDQRYAAKARDALVALPASPKFRADGSTTPACATNWSDFSWRYPQVVAQAAISYDWLRGSAALSGVDAEVVRGYLLDAVRRMYAALVEPRELNGDNYRNIVNFRVRNAAGMGITTLILRSFGVTDPVVAAGADYAYRDLLGDTGRGWREFIFQMTAADGVYKEGQSYYSDSFRLVWPYLLVLKRLDGRDVFATDPRFRAVALSETRQMMPDGNPPTYDTGFVGAAGFGPWVAAQYPADAPTLYWTWQRQGRPAFDQWYYLALYRADLDAGAREPAMSPTQFLTDSQFAFLRSGWGSDATWLMLNSERLPDWSAHEQPDQTSFALYAKGAYLAVDPGDGRNCPGGDRFARSAQAHNLVLVDGQGPRVKWETYTEATDPATLDRTVDTPTLDYARTSMTYDALNVSTTRSVLFPHGHYYLVLDDLRGAASHRYDWQIHFGQRKDQSGQLTRGDHSAAFTVPNAAGVPVTLDTYVAAPDGATWTEQVGQTGYVAGAGNCWNHPYLQVGATGRDVAYKAVLYPTAQGEQRPVIARNRHGGVDLLSVDAAGYHDVVFDNATARPVTVDGISTDAARVFASRHDTGMTGLLAAAARWVTVDGQLRLAASRPVDATVSWSASAVVARVDVAGTTPVTLATGGRTPRKVTVDGTPVHHTYNARSGLVGFVVPRSADVVVTFA